MVPVWRKKLDVLWGTGSGRCGEPFFIGYGWCGVSGGMLSGKKHILDFKNLCCKVT